jgi:hypothetical protein
MTVAPSEILSLPIRNAKTLLGDTAGWIAWTGADDATAAKVFIHEGAEPATATRPFCVVDLAGFDMTMIGGGSRHQFRESGSVLLLFQDAATESDDTDAHFDFLNNLGTVLTDMRELAGSGGYLLVNRIALESIIARSTVLQGETTNYYEAIVRLDYGVT